MKKILAILSAAALVFAVAGCASTKKAATTTADAKATEAAAPAVATINNPDPTGEIELLDGFESRIQIDSSDNRFESVRQNRVAAVLERARSAIAEH